jgi:hypothetical protein
MPTKSVQFAATVGSGLLILGTLGLTLTGCQSANSQNPSAPAPEAQSTPGGVAPDSGGTGTSTPESGLSSPNAASPESSPAPNAGSAATPAPGSSAATPAPGSGSATNPSPATPGSGSTSVPGKGF